MLFRSNTDAPGPSNVPPPNIDLDEEWAEPALENDIASVDGSVDEPFLSTQNSMR